MIWIYLGTFVTLMAAPFLLSWHYTGQGKRTVLSLPADTSDIPLRKKEKRITGSEDVIELDSLDATAGSIYEKPLSIQSKAFFAKTQRCLQSVQSHAASSLEADEYLSVGGRMRSAGKRRM